MCTKTLVKQALAATLVALLLGACADETEPGAQALPSNDNLRGRVDVVLTQPFCDVCSGSDKAFLLARSPIIANVVHLIDNATRSVDVAQYTFSQRPIRDALLRAHDRGIPVRVAMDDGQDRPGTRATELIEGGLTVHFSDGSGGIQHAKFMVIDADTVLTGSNNFSSTGTSINEENTLIIRGANDPRVAGFKCHFEIIWNDSGSATSCASDVAAFSPSSKARDFVSAQVKGAKVSVQVMMHHLMYDRAIRDLADAAERGVQVRVLVNEADVEEHRGGHWERLLEHGGRIRYKRGNPDLYQLLHHKLAIIDGHTLVNGSGNWSAGGFFRNYENFVLYREANVLARFRELFHRLWTWSLDAGSLEQGGTAAAQHAQTTRHMFGNLHAHFDANDGATELDDGKPEVLDGNGNSVAVHAGDGVDAPARYAYDYARNKGGLDFMALTPHCREDSESDTSENMSHAGYAELRNAAENVTDAAFVALAGMEWSSNSSGNHVGIIGSSKLSKIERGRFDLLYSDFMRERAFDGERVFLMLNHPKTFRTNDESLAGSWDMIYGVNLLDVPKSSERKRKFNDFGLDDFSPLKDVHANWVAGDALPDPAVVDETWATILGTVGDNIRLMEVTLNRGNDLGQETPKNPSIVESRDEVGMFERRTKVHSDFDYFLTRGFRIAPVASHDNHFANWGTGHTTRTVAIGDELSERALLDAIEYRETYASEDQNMELRLYADDRSPMGSVHRTRGDDVSLELLIADADYSGNYLVKLYQGSVGKDGVAVTEELVDVAAGSHSLTVKTPAAGTHFAYVEVHQLDSDRMAWSAPLWIVHLSKTPDPPLVDDVDDGGNGGGGAGGTDDDGGEPPAGRLVINEIDYDQPGSDLGEFVEIYNGSSESVSLAGLSLVAVNGATSADYRRIDLSLGSALLGPGEYLVIGTEAALDGVPDGVAKIQLPQVSNNLQNGAPDAVAIVDMVNGVVVDALSYEGAVTGGEVVGVGSFSFVEGNATDAKDQGDSALARTPNGSDTGDAMTDWQLVAPTPGSANL